MIRNYIKIAFRALWRDKTHSFINVLGLSIGIACCFLIVLFVKDEWTFDAFHNKADRIYRAYVKEDYGENEKFFNTVTPFPLGPVLKDNYTEVESEVRVNQIAPIIRVGEDQFTDQVTIVGKDFFSVFDFDFHGDQNALSNQSNVVITSEMAKKYFGKNDPVGKTMSIQLGEQFEDFKVAAIVEEVPTNSSIQFDILISDLNYPKLYSERALTSSWFNVNPETYILLKKGVVVNELEKKFPALFKSLLGEDYAVSNYTVGLQPLTDIHLNQDFPAGIAPVNNPKYSYILAAIAILILFVACINFITLSIGRSLRRAKEVGIRKVAGAMRSQLTVQFLSEAVTVTLISLGTGILIAILCLPLFNELSGKSLIIEFNLFLVSIAMTLVIIIGVVSGSYPALLLSGFKPIAILKGTGIKGGEKQRLRKVLVGVQLVLSIFLISSTLIMRKQLQFIQNKNLGFDKEQVMVLPLNVTANGGLLGRINAGFESSKKFKTEFSNIASVVSVSAASHDFANGNWTNIGYTDDSDNYRTFNVNVIDADYIPMMNMNLVEGRNFSEENQSDKRRSIIVNEAFAKEYGWNESALGKRIPGKNFQDHEVIGVVKDFHFASLYNKVDPLVLVMDIDVLNEGIENIGINNSPIPKVFVRLQPGSLPGAIDEIKESWTKITGGEQFNFSFVDQALTSQYRADQDLSKVLSIATILAILIGSLGLYGLASLAMQGRIKEISIRKVLGANEQSLLILLSKDYVVLVLLSLILSVPFTIYLMKEWLAGFEYKITLGPDSFLLAGGISLIVALLTISYLTFKTAWTQPAETLKHE